MSDISYMCMHTKYWTDRVKECLNYKSSYSDDYCNLSLKILYKESQNYNFNKQCSILLNIHPCGYSLSLPPYIQLSFSREESDNWDTHIRCVNIINDKNILKCTDFIIPGDFTWYIIPSIDNESKTFYIDMYKYEQDIWNPNYYTKYNSNNKQILREPDYKYTKSHVHQLIDHTSRYTNISSRKFISLCNEEDVYIYDMLLSLFKIY